MESPKDWINQEREMLQRTRDELRVKLHLASEDMKEVWDKVERKWLELEDSAKQLTSAAEPAAKNIGDAARLLVSEIREGYHKIAGGHP